MSDADTKRFTTLIEKVAQLDSTCDLPPAEKAEYEQLADAWYDAQPVPQENYGF